MNSVPLLRHPRRFVFGAVLLLLASFSASAGIHGPSVRAVRAGGPTYVILSATVVQARTPTPPEPGASPTTAPITSTTVASPSATAVPLGTLSPIPSPTPPIPVQGTWTALVGTQTALAATETALATTPSVTRTPAPSPTPSATPVPCLDAYEDDGVPARARPIVVGEAQQHIFCPAGDADWLTFFGKTGKGYRIMTSDLSMGVDTYCYVLASDARTVLGYNDDAPGAQGPSQLLFVPPIDGWYFVLVKNQGDIGFPGATYTIRLDLVDVPTATAAVTASPTATLWFSPTPPPHPASTFTPTGSPFLSPEPAGMPTGTANPLLQPQSGGAGTANLPIFRAGPVDGSTPDWLEPNDSFEQAAPVNLGAVYQDLNFVPAPSGATDADFYAFRAKPGNCYLVQTGDLSPGLDTTILLWQPAATREGRQLLGQNDDAHAHTADLSSAVRWCSARDTLVVIEVRNYGLAPLTDPRGKTYSLAVLIDPPTPTLSPTPRLTTPSVPSGDGSWPSPLPRTTLLPTLPPLPTVPAPPTRLPTATAVPAITAPVAAPTMILLPSSVPSETPTATPTPIPLAVDVIAYVGQASSSGPLPGDGIAGWPVQLIDQRTNTVLQTELTDANGHAHLTWIWTGPIAIVLPLLAWSHPLTDPRDPAVSAPLYARAESYPLPGIWP